MVRKKKEELGETKRRLLQTGLSLMMDKGYSAAGIQEIAAASGIPKGSFYNYFSSKEEFGAAVIRYYTDNRLKDWCGYWTGSGGRQQPYEALCKAFAAVAGRNAGDEPVRGCLIGTMAAEIGETGALCRKALEESNEKFQLVLAECLEEGQRAGKIRTDLSARLLADVLWDCWQGSLLRMKTTASAEPVKTDLQTMLGHLLLP